MSLEVTQATICVVDPSEPAIVVHYCNDFISNNQSNSTFQKRLLRQLQRYVFIYNNYYISGTSHQKRDTEVSLEQQRKVSNKEFHGS